MSTFDTITSEDDPRHRPSQSVSFNMEQSGLTSHKNNPAFDQQHHRPVEIKVQNLLASDDILGSSVSLPPHGEGDDGDDGEVDQPRQD